MMIWVFFACSLALTYKEEVSGAPLKDSEFKDLDKGFSCESKCHGQYDLCDKVAKSLDEQIICISRRMSCLTECVGIDLRKTTRNPDTINGLEVGENVRIH